MRTISLANLVLIIMVMLALTYRHVFQYEGTRDGVLIYEGFVAVCYNWLFCT